MRNYRLPIIFITALTIVAAFFSGSQSASAAGSDAPTPYTVDTAGITLPVDVSFTDNGHVNVHTSVGNRNLHFEGKCIDRTDAECAGDRHVTAQFIGASFLPWSAFNLGDTFCVSWVQLSGFNEHFGEGKQEPVCVSPEPVEPELVEVCWLLPDGGTADNVTWPQTYVSDCVPPCETTLQVDTYPVDAVPALIAAGILEQGDDYGIVTQWRFGAGADCPVAAPPVEPPVVVPPVEPPVVVPPVEPPVTPPTEPPVVVPPVEPPTDEPTVDPSPEPTPDTTVEPVVKPEARDDIRRIPDETVTAEPVAEHLATTGGSPLPIVLLAGSLLVAGFVLWLIGKARKGKAL